MALHRPATGLSPYERTPTPRRSRSWQYCRARSVDSRSCKRWLCAARCTDDFDSHDLRSRAARFAQCSLSSSVPDSSTASRSRPGPACRRRLQQSPALRAQQLAPSLDGCRPVLACRGCLQQARFGRARTAAPRDGNGSGRHVRLSASMWAQQWEGFMSSSRASEVCHLSCRCNV